jgi:hypothetical protein
LGIHGHRCIFQVFEDAYEKIRFVELDLTPPTIFLQNEPPPVPPLMRPPNIAGIFLGEDLDKDDE